MAPGWYKSAPLALLFFERGRGARGRRARQANTYPQNQPFHPLGRLRQPPQFYSVNERLIMKTLSQWMAGVAGVAVMAGTVFAQDYGSYGSNQESSQNGRYRDAKELLGQEVNNQQGHTLGHIKDIAFNTQNGQVFAVIGLGNNQNALVPVQVLNVTGNQNNPQVTLDATQQGLMSGPIVQNNRWEQALNSPGFTQRIYSHYNFQLQPGADVGVVIVTPVPQASGAGNANLGGGSSGTGAATGNQSQNSFPQQGSGAKQQEQGLDNEQ
jgi:hypothetical protein